MKYFLGAALAIAVNLCVGCVEAPVTGMSVSATLDGDVEVLALQGDTIEHASSTFQQEVNRSDSTLVLVDCWAPWCGPCRALAPELESLKKKWQDKLVVVKLNVDENPGLARELKANAIPAVRIFRKGTMVSDFVGLMKMQEIDAILTTVK